MHTVLVVIASVLFAVGSFPTVFSATKFNFVAAGLFVITLSGIVGLL